MERELELLQAEFAAGVLVSDRIILGKLCGGAGLDAERRFAVYRDGYRSRLIEALQDSFGHTATYLGDEAFHELALRYVEEHPPARYSVRWYGDAFPTCLRAARPQDPEIAELASLDWALRSAFDSADAEPLGAAELARLDPEDWTRAVFHLQPAFRILGLHWNTLAIWHALDREETPPAATPLDAESMVLVWRRDLRPHFRTLEPDEDQALRALDHGETFACVCARLAECRPPQEAAALAGRWLRRWVDEALLVVRR